MVIRLPQPLNSRITDISYLTFCKSLNVKKVYDGEIPIPFFVKKKVVVILTGDAESEQLGLSFPLFPQNTSAFCSKYIIEIL